MRIKNSPVPIGTPPHDYVGLYSTLDSLHFKNDTGKDWNLGLISEMMAIFDLNAATTWVTSHAYYKNNLVYKERVAPLLIFKNTKLEQLLQNNFF